MSVEYNDKIFKVISKKGGPSLDLSDQGIKDINEILGLDSLTNLKHLNLNNNIITEIKGLANLRNLETLSLKNNNISEIKGLENLNLLKILLLSTNNISEIKGLGSLVLLKRIELSENPVRDWARNTFGRYWMNPQPMVKYCQQKVSKVIKEDRDKQTREQTVQYIKKLPSIYEEITFNEMSNRTGIKTENLKILIEDMVFKGDISAQISGNKLIFKKQIPMITPPLKEPIPTPQPPSVFKSKELEVLRGGDWKIEGDQSVFYYKVKIQNNSQFVITNIQILLTSIPRGLEVQTDRYKIDYLKPNSLESPTFKLNAKESCVGDVIEGLITYTDPMGSQQSVSVQPFKIKYVCNLLSPKEISRKEFNEKVEFMEEKKIIIDSNLDISELELKIEKIVKNCNFAMLQQIQETQDENFRKIEGFAEGLYDKQDVALSVAVKKMDYGSKLVVKAMSDRPEKLTDLLKDFSVKLDDIKSDTELIKEYTSQIEEIFEKTEDLETFLRTRLATDFEKIKNAWEDYKTGKIGKKELIIEGIKMIGKQFMKKMIVKIF